VWDNAYKKMIDNGGSITSQVYDGDWGIASDVRVGRNGYGSGGGSQAHYVWGHVKDVKIWNRTLSDNSLIRITT